MAYRDIEKRRERERERYKQNPEKFRVKSAEWRDKNPEKVQSQWARWYQNNPGYKVAQYEKNQERERQRSADWRSKNRGKYLEVKAKYRRTHQGKIKQDYEAHKDRWIIYQATRRAKLLSAPGSHTPADLKSIWDRQKGKCANPTCRAVLTVTKGPQRRHLDHIVALVNGGSNSPENLQYLCQTCNLSKSHADDQKWANENGMLFAK